MDEAGADSRARVLRYDGNKRIAVGLSWLDHPHRFLRSRSPLAVPLCRFFLRILRHLGKQARTWVPRGRSSSPMIVANSPAVGHNARRDPTLPVSDSSPRVVRPRRLRPVVFARPARRSCRHHAGQDSHALRPAKGRQDEGMEEGQRGARAGRERVARLDGVRSAREAACSLVP